jgi:hypothetical protein
MSERYRIGAKLRRFSETQPVRYPDSVSIARLYPAYSENGAVVRLTSEMVERVFSGHGTLSCVLAVAAALSRKVTIRYWKWKAKDSHRVLDLASDAGLNEATTRAVVAALNSWGAASGALHIRSIEAVLFTQPDAELILEQG